MAGTHGLSRWGWAFLIVAIVAAVAFRFYRLGTWPPGPYRDEAYNGLDALDVLRGRLTLFFPANNGREPFYIYLVALAVALFGPTTLALRLPAAFIGSLTTIPTFLLGRAWFGRVAGLIAVFLWAITFWPVHLGRIGLRAGLLAPLMTLAFWLGTRAYREQRAIMWFLAGIVYGLSFYTYLAVRFTPVLLVLFAVYMIMTGRCGRLWDEGRSLWFLLGGLLAILPLATVFVGDPSILIGRAGQVSILSAEVSSGDPLNALLRNIGRALGMFLYRGDTILRHNAMLSYGDVLRSGASAGRPVFDWLMAAPFLIGLVWCIREWRRPAAAFLLLWTAVMLGPTILAEDAPHFLRAAGVLPAALFFPAIGLTRVWEWERLPVYPRRAAVALLLIGSALITLRDYAAYGRQPDVGFLFESAAADLAQAAIADSEAGRVVYLDRRFPDGWPSVRYLLSGQKPDVFDSQAGLPAAPDQPTAIYAWPYNTLDYLSRVVVPPAVVEIAPGPLARGDLEPQPYSLYTRYGVAPGTVKPGLLADFDGAFLLRRGAAELMRPDRLEIALSWDPVATPGEGLPNLFIHVIGPEGMLAQYDGLLGHGLWPAADWQPGIIIGERHDVTLSRPFDVLGDQIQVGLYWPGSTERLPVFDTQGQDAGDHVILRLEP